MLGLPILTILCCLAELCLVSWIVKYSIPSNILSLITGIVKFATVAPGLNLTLIDLPAKSLLPVN